MKKIIGAALISSILISGFSFAQITNQQLFKKNLKNKDKEKTVANNPSARRAASVKLDH